MVQDVIVCSYSFIKPLTNIYTKDIVQFPSQIQNRGMRCNKVEATNVHNSTHGFLFYSISRTAPEGPSVTIGH